MDWTTLWPSDHDRFTTNILSIKTSLYQKNTTTHTFFHRNNTISVSWFGRESLTSIIDITIWQTFCVVPYSEDPDSEWGQTLFLCAPGEPTHESLIYIYNSTFNSHTHRPDVGWMAGIQTPLPAEICPAKLSSNKETESLLAPKVLSCSWPWPSCGGGRESRHFLCGDQCYYCMRRAAHLLKWIEKKVR